MFGKDLMALQKEIYNKQNHVQGEIYVGTLEHFELSLDLMIGFQLNGFIVWLNLYQYIWICSYPRYLD